MSPRPRKATDDAIFAATYRAMQRLGPRELTLAAIATEAGVTAGALVQRFGSKHGLQVALAAGAAEGAGEMMRELRARHRSPLAALRDYAACMGQLAASPAALARNLAYLTQDLADPVLRRHLLVQARATRAEIRALLAEAVERGELAAATDPARLARTVETVISGALFSWAVYREGRADRYVVEHVDAILDGHRRGRRGPRDAGAPRLTPRGGRRRG